MKKQLPMLALVCLSSMLGATRATAQRCSTCVGEDTMPRLHVLPALGLHVGTPQKASVALGVVVGEDWQQYVSHGFGSFGSGYGIIATALRTWRDPWVAKDNATYVGGEVLIWPIVFVGPRIGVFRRTTGNTSNGRWFVSLDLGIGL
jgi:hypothetical protein